MSAIERLGINPLEVKQLEYSKTQEQTKESFGFKWVQKDTYDSPAVQEFTRNWLLEKYCGSDPDVLKKWLGGERKIILDAGCGAGWSALLLFGEALNKSDYIGLDISDAVWVAKRKFQEKNIQGDFLKCDILHSPIPESSVDIIFSEGVLHHTDSTGEAIKILSRLLKKGGLFLFYVYSKKSVIREFTDDFIRKAIQPLTDEEAWSALEPLTKLGMALGNLNQEINIPEDIPFLGIKKGKMDLQRFFYWNICKLYYRREYGIEEMNHINFDWFRPLNCHRQTPEEVARFCKDAGLDIERMHVEEAGITVIARKS